MKNLTYIFLIAGVSSCTSFSNYPSDYNLEVSDVIYNLKCDLHKAVTQFDFDSKKYSEFQWIKNWNAAFTVSLVVLQETSLGSDATFKIPLTTGSLSLKVAAGNAETASRTAKFKFNEEMHRTSAEDCQKGARTAGNKKLLHGEIGLTGWVRALVQSVDDTDIEIESFNYNLEFTIKPNAELNPTFSLLPIGLPDTISGSLSAKGSEEVTHSVLITFVPSKTRRPIRPTRVPLLIGAKKAPPSLRGGIQKKVPTARERRPRLSVEEKRDLKDAQEQNILEELFIRDDN